jgi:hypothetical protein
MQSPKIKGAQPAATATIDPERCVEAHADCHKFVQINWFKDPQQEAG